MFDVFTRSCRVRLAFSRSLSIEFYLFFEEDVEKLSLMRVILFRNLYVELKINVQRKFEDRILHTNFSNVTDFINLHFTF